MAARGADEWVADLQLNVPGRRLLTGEDCLLPISHFRFPIADLKSRNRQ